jgi:hypothetical protein
VRRIITNRNKLVNSCSKLCEQLQTRMRNLVFLSNSEVDGWKSDNEKAACFVWARNWVKSWSYLCKRPWRPIGLSEVQASTFSRQSAHRWRWCCQPYAPGALYPQEDSWYSFLLEAEDPRAIVRLASLGQLKKPSDLNGNETRGLPASIIVTQPSTLPRADRN